jgi:uncharacterized surface protein with fasciclin (FAS1) repeats
MDRERPGKRCRAVSSSKQKKEVHTMSWRVLPVSFAAVSVALAGCERGEEANQTNAAQPSAAREAAGEQTIAAGLDQNSRFFQAIKSAGLDATLAGPGPYTVLVPDDQAFAKLPAGTMEGLIQPQQRARLTEVLTYHILPGTVLVEDIGRAIDNADGRAVLATMGGETLNAVRDGDRIVLTDAAGGRAVIAEGDLRRSNGVAHRIDGVLMPREGGSAQEEPEPAQQ